MASTNLYQPSLAPDTIRETKSYNIGSMFYVAFFGGVVALSVIGMRNGRWLNLRQNVLYGLIAAAAVVFLAKMGFYYAYFNEYIEIERQSVKFVARGAELLLFGAFYFAMKKAFRQHLLLGGDTVSMKKDGIIACVISILIEGVCLMVIASTAS